MLKGRDLVSIADLNREEVQQVFDRATALKKELLLYLKRI